MARMYQLCIHTKNSQQSALIAKRAAKAPAKWAARGRPRPIDGFNCFSTAGAYPQATLRFVGPCHDSNTSRGHRDCLHSVF
jgi:hypothetical protein